MLKEIVNLVVHDITLEGFDFRCVKIAQVSLFIKFAVENDLEKIVFGNSLKGVM